MKARGKIRFITRKFRYPISWVVVLFSMNLFLVHCKKKEKAVGPGEQAMQQFLESSVYNDFIQKHASLARHVSTGSARIVRLNKQVCTIHIPVVENGKIRGVIVGLPAGKKGGYELVYQDNRGALSGNGCINVNTSGNQLFTRIHVSKGRIQSVEPVFRLDGYLRTRDPSMDCNFFCRLSQCYNELKTKFPGDAVCGLLDIFMGVCTSATVASCLIKMAVE